MRREGFTILEILIVVMLIGVLTAVGLSQLGGGSSVYLDARTRIVRSNLRFAAERAIATGRTHRWVCDLDEQRFRIEEQVSVEEDEKDKPVSNANLLDLAPPVPDVEFRPIGKIQGNWAVLEDGDIEDLDVLIDVIAIGEEEYEEGRIWVSFAGDGGADPAEVWLSNRAGHTNGLRVMPFTGEIRSIEEDAL